MDRTVVLEMLARAGADINLADRAGGLVRHALENAGLAKGMQTLVDCRGLATYGECQSNKA